MHDGKLLRYIQYLNHFNVLKGIRKELVVSYAENLNSKQLQELERNNINVKVIGHQDLPEEEDLKGWTE